MFKLEQRKKKEQSVDSQWRILFTQSHGIDAVSTLNVIFIADVRF